VARLMSLTPLAITPYRLSDVDGLGWDRKRWERWKELAALRVEAVSGSSLYLLPWNSRM